MKRLLETAVTVLTALLVATCAREKIIPDKTLALIFHDAFLTNAYISNRNIPTDSLDIYEPIFEKYGYTSEDVQHTIGNFSKRKSARLGDVVEQAIKMLEDEGMVYERETSVLDTIDNIARRTFTRTVYSDTLIRVGRLRDTSRLHITVEDIRAGEYKISYAYQLDSLDDNLSRHGTFVFERADSSKFARQQHNLRKTAAPERISRTMRADTSARRLIMNLMEFTRPKNPRHTGITITDLTVIHIPEVEAAVDSLYGKQLVIKIFADEFTKLFQTDSVALRAAADGDNR